MTDHTTLDAEASEVPEVVPAPAPVRIVGGPQITKLVPLQWPVAVGEREITAIGIRRLTAREVADYLALLVTLPESERGRIVHLPMYTGDDGEPVSAATLDGLLDDDLYAVTAAASDFLPRRFWDDPMPASPATEG